MRSLQELEAPQEGETAASLQRLPSPVAVRLDKLSEVAKVNTDAIRLAQEEICEYRRQLQSKTTELEALKGTQESLERQRQDSEERHHADVLSYQVAWRSGQHPRPVISQEEPPHCRGGAVLVLWPRRW